MAAGVFRFKRFEVRNERSAMKVNTDGVLLGAATMIPDTPPQTDGPFEVLDAGTGTGTIALMLAQRLSDAGIDFSVKGIDIDADAALEAGENFAQAPWSRNLRAENVPLSRCEGRFDLIVSNPPYYDESLQNPDARKNLARHTAARDEEGREGAPMSWRTLLDYASSHLKDHGELALVLPADQEAALLRYARMCGFAPVRILRIRTTERKAPSRIVVQLGHRDAAPGPGHFAMPGPGLIAGQAQGHIKENPSTEAEGTTDLTQNLTIQCQGFYTDDYRRLMSEFYLWA